MIAAFLIGIDEQQAFDAEQALLLVFLSFTKLLVCAGPLTEGFS